LFSATSDVDIEASPFPQLDENLLPGNLPKHALRVLIVDDSKLARKMVGRMLKSIQASSGEEALEIVKKSLEANEQKIDVVLMDYYMPGLIGSATVELLRSVGYYGCIVALTAAASNVERKELLLKGTDAVIGKPIDLQHFVDTIDGTLAYFLL
jgi:CheY-like chemotaxis protein